MAKVIHKKGSKKLAKLFLETYDPQSSDDVQNSFKYSEVMGNFRSSEMQNFSN